MARGELVPGMTVSLWSIAGRPRGTILLRGSRRENLGPRTPAFEEEARADREHA
jgi:hypothetical protein